VHLLCQWENPAFWGLIGWLKRENAKLWITSLNSHLSKIYSDTKYGFLSMRTKRNPHRAYASGDKRKEELTKRLCSLVDNSQDSCKKVPSAKNRPTEQFIERPTGVKGKSMGHPSTSSGQVDSQSWPDVNARFCHQQS
jgi:hypothetical protein